MFLFKDGKKFALSVFIVLIAIAGLLFWGGSFSGQRLPADDSEKIMVVATFFPLYDFAKNVGGEKVNVNMIFFQTPEAASFKPGDVRKVAQADMLVKNGVGLEPILDELVASSGNKNLIILDTSAGVEIFSNDPHIWLDPRNAAIQVQNIRDSFVARDQANAEFYDANAVRYIAELYNLDVELEKTIGEFSSKDFIAFHPAFGYFAKRYGLNQSAVFEEFPGKEPSPARIAEIINIIKERNTSALFAEPQFSPKIMETIARDLNLKVYTLNPAETGDLDKESYIGIMRENLKNLQKAFEVAD